MKNIRNIIVYDKHCKLLSPCNEKVARVLLHRKRAIELGDNAIKLILNKKDLKIMKNKVLERDNRICFYCGRNIPLDEIATIDHVIPKKIDLNGNCGYDTEENMVCCCYNCNKHKADMSFEDYMIYRYSILIAYMKVINKRN